jgi:hypothetical protein
MFQHFHSKSVWNQMGWVSQQRKNERIKKNQKRGNGMFSSFFFLNWNNICYVETNLNNEKGR